jgi:ankyrin repeat protein
MTAAKGGKLKQVQLLLKAGASVHQHQLEGDQEGVLHMAAFTRGPECAGIIEALVQAGADVRATNVHRHTPLVSAVQADNEVAVKMLLASGSNPRVISPGDGCSLLFAARSVPVFKLLLDAGVDVNEPTSDGARLLHTLAVRKPTSVPLLCMAIKAGAELSALCGKSPPRTAAAAAARAGNALAAQLLNRAAQDVQRGAAQ